MFYDSSWKEPQVNLVLDSKVFPIKQSHRILEYEEPVEAIEYNFLLSFLGILCHSPHYTDSDCLFHHLSSLIQKK